MKPEKVTDDELLSYIQDEISNSHANTLDELSIQRIESNRAYVNDNTIRTAPSSGMSSIPFFFTPSVCDTLTMYMSKIFCSDKETVVFNPANKSEENLLSVKQLQSVVNEVLHKENRGFELITDLFRTAAVNKNGVAKVVWSEEMEITEQMLNGIDPQTLPVVIQQLEDEGFDVEVIEKEEETVTLSEEVTDQFSGEVIQEAQTQQVGNYTLRLERMAGGVRIYVLPPEEFVINEDTTSIHDPLTRFIAHSKEMYEGDISAMFPDVDVSTLQSFFDLEDYYEKLARHAVDGTLNDYGLQQGQAEGVTKIVITESWIRADRDGDGYPEWRHTFSCGNTLLSDEEWFGPLPFASFTFFPIPHKFYGQSVYDRIRPYEEAATSLMRADIDMTRLKNTFRMFAKEGTVDRRTLQSGRPGTISVANTFNPQDVLVVPSPQGSNNTLPNIEELRRQVIANVGIDPVSGQVSTDIEKSGNDAAKTAMVIDNASAKLEGYARRFAEGTLRDMVWLIAMEMVKHDDDPFVNQIVNSVTPGQPFLAAQQGVNNVMTKSGITAKVGLGHQTSQQKAQAAGVVTTMIQQLSTQPSQAMYNMTGEALKGFGYDNPEALLGPLEEWTQKAQQAQQAQQSQIQVAQQQQQVAQQQVQLQQQQVQGQLQIAQQESQAKIQREALESQAKIAEMQSKTQLNNAKTEAENTATTIRQGVQFEPGKANL